MDSRRGVFECLTTEYTNGNENRRQEAHENYEENFIYYQRSEGEGMEKIYWKKNVWDCEKGAIERERERGERGAISATR
jgi:hypothetical protein